MIDAEDRRLVAFFAPQFVVDAIDRAADGNLMNRSAFLRQAVWKHLGREGWTINEPRGGDDRQPA